VPTEEPSTEHGTSPAPTGLGTPPPPPPPKARPDREARAEPLGSPKKKRSFWKELPVLIVIAFVVALLIKSFLIQAFYIPSGSMEPTLKVGDRVLVEKASDWFGSPSRGDVIVFEREVGMTGALEEPDEPIWTDISNAFKSLFGFPTAGSQDFIKRVIAVEGDTIRASKGVVYVNNEPIDEPYLPEGTQTSDFGRVDVGQDEIFVMGDNRANSDDSRSFGAIPESSVVGKAFILIWPPADFGTV
jgi:signal peptidase I